MFKRFILGCSNCSSFVVTHVSSGVDDICTVLSNQTFNFFVEKMHTMLIRSNFNARVCDAVPDRTHKLQNCIHITMSYYNLFVFIIQSMKGADVNKSVPEHVSGMISCNINLLIPISQSEISLKARVMFIEATAADF